YRTVGRTERRQRQAVRGGSGGDPEGTDFFAEQVGKNAVEAKAPLVAVIGSIEPVGGGDGLDHLWVRCCRIVGEKTHGAEWRRHRKASMWGSGAAGED